MVNNSDKNSFAQNNKKKYNAKKSINNYLSQLKLHFELSDDDLYDVLKKITLDYKKTISSKRWWRIFS